MLLDTGITFEISVVSPESECVPSGISIRSKYRGKKEHPVHSRRILRPQRFIDPTHSRVWSTGEVLRKKANVIKSIKLTELANVDF